MELSHHVGRRVLPCKCQGRVPVCLTPVPKERTYSLWIKANLQVISSQLPSSFRFPHKPCPAPRQQLFYFAGHAVGAPEMNGVPVMDTETTLGHSPLRQDSLVNKSTL